MMIHETQRSTTRQPRVLSGMAALAAAALLSGCVPPAESPADEQGPPALCHAYFPKGIPASQGWVAITPKVVFHIRSSYNLKDPNLARELIPRAYIAAMRAANPDLQATLADGTLGNMNIDVALIQDATADHYGMVVQVSGPESFFKGQGEVNISNWFRLYVAPTYVTGEKLISDAAARTAKYVMNGWTCYSTMEVNP